MENKTNNTNGFGIACLVLGIVGMLTTCLFFGIIPCILSLIFGLIGIFQKNQSKTTSIIGLSCSSIGIIIFICIVIAVNLVPTETTSKETETIEKNIDNIDEIDKLETNYLPKNKINLLILHSTKIDIKN